MSDVKKIFIITAFSCLLSIGNISYRISQDYNKKEDIELIKDGKWDILLLRMDEIQSVGQVSEFLQKTNVKRADRIVFGFVDKKDWDKKWNESLLIRKAPNLEDIKLTKGGWWNDSDGRPPLKTDFPPIP